MYSAAILRSRDPPPLSCVLHLISCPAKASDPPFVRSPAPSSPQTTRFEQMPIAWLIVIDCASAGHSGSFLYVKPILPLAVVCSPNACIVHARRRAMPLLQLS